MVIIDALIDKNARSFVLFENEVENILTKKNDDDDDDDDDDFFIAYLQLFFFRQKISQENFYFSAGSKLFQA